MPLSLIIFVVLLVLFALHRNHDANKYRELWQHEVNKKDA